MSSWRGWRVAAAVAAACLLLLASVSGDRAKAASTLLASQGFAGSAACAKCHAAIHTSHGKTAMRAALLAPGDARGLAGKAPVKGPVGPATYAIESVPGGGYEYRATFGGEFWQAPVRWAFGLGAAGQTYVLEHEGRLYESRVSYYDAIAGLDLTMGAANAAPKNLTEAAGRAMSAGDIRDCFGCHALGVPAKGEPVLNGIEPGVGCESCHGPAAAHVAARTGFDLKSGRMPSLKHQEAEEISQLCGKCHRSWEDVVSLRIRGVNNVRFQPYRLTLSRCYDSSDARISCVACHNPHANVVEGAAAYDAKCTACHGGDAAIPRAKAGGCREGETANCSGCHMPKRELPGAHRLFTDHYIGVHREGEAYPDM